MGRSVRRLICFALFRRGASSTVSGGENDRVLCAFSAAQDDPGLVLLSLAIVAAAAAAAVVGSVVVVVVLGLVLLLASPVTRLGSIVGGRVPLLVYFCCASSDGRLRALIKEMRCRFGFEVGQYCWAN